MYLCGHSGVLSSDALSEPRSCKLHIVLDPYDFACAELGLPVIRPLHSSDISL